MAKIQTPRDIAAASIDTTQDSRDQGWQEYLLAVLGRIFGRAVDDGDDLFGEPEPDRREPGYWP